MGVLYDFLFIAGILFSSIYIYIFYKSKERGLSKSILIVFFALLVFVLLESYGHIHKIKLLQRIIFLPTQGVKLALGPILLLYIQSLFLNDKKVLKNGLIYLAPYILFVVLVSLPYLIAVVTQEYFVSYKNFVQQYLSIKRLICDIVFLVFIYRSFKTFNRFKQVLKCNYSYIEHNNFIWVRYLLIAPLIIIFMDLFFIGYQLIFGYLEWRTISVITLMISISIFTELIMGLNSLKYWFHIFYWKIPLLLLQTKN